MAVMRGQVYTHTHTHILHCRHKNNKLKFNKLFTLLFATVCISDIEPHQCHREQEDPLGSGEHVAGHH